MGERKRTLVSLLRSSSGTKVLRRPRGEQAREHHRAHGPRGLRVYRSDLLSSARGAEPAERDSVCVRPEGLRVREERVQPGDDGRTPQVGRGPAVRQELGRGGEGECVRVEEGEHVREEEPAVRGDLSMYVV